MCLYIDGYILAIAKPKKFLIYNLEECIGKTFDIHNTLTYNILLSLTDPINAYSIIIDQDISNLNDLQKIILFLKQNFWGDCIYILENKDKPITFVPICNLENYKQTGFKSITEITIAINNELSKSHKKQIQRQFPYIYQHSEYKEIELELLKEFLSKLSSDIIINITGGNIFMYSKFKQLYEYLSCFNNTRFFFRKEYINKDFHFETPYIIIEGPTDNDMTFCKKNDSYNISFYFIVKNETELKTATFIKNELNKSNAIIQPFWNDNEQFLKKYVFFEKNDILLQNKLKTDIYLNKTINKIFYGNLFINPKGDIYTSYKFPSVGKYTDEVEVLLKNATDKNQAWHFIRNSGPCANCIYQWFCPSISDYEFFLNNFISCK